MLCSAAENLYNCFESLEERNKKKGETPYVPAVSKGRIRSECGRGKSLMIIAEVEESAERSCREKEGKERRCAYAFVAEGGYRWCLGVVEWWYGPRTLGMIGLLRRKLVVLRERYWKA